MLLYLQDFSILNKKEKVIAPFDFEIEENTIYPLVYNENDQEKAFLLDYEKIKWISTYKGKSTLHTTIGKYNVNMLLCELEERLDFPPFVRCHRSYIVNLNYVEEVVTWFNGTYNLKVGEEEIPVSRSKAKELEEMLGI